MTESRGDIAAMSTEDDAAAAAAASGADTAGCFQVEFIEQR